MKTTQILDFMKVLSWIIFIGLSIKAGALMISFCISLFSNPMAAENLYLGLDLSEVYNIEKRYYINVVSFVIAIAIMKAYLFYLVIRMFSKLNLEDPFRASIAKLISEISYSSFSIGVVALIANRYVKWLLNKGLSIRLNFESQEFLFMGGILFIIALIFKRGIEIKSENDLTI